MRLELRRFHFHPNVLRQILAQGLPSGIQSSVISVGNLVVQANINSFGAYAISGHGAYAKIEGLVFLPIMSISLALPTFVSQNLGAQKYDRVKKGAAAGILSGMALAELTGILLFFVVRYALRLFVDSDEAIYYGNLHGQTVALFFFLLAFSHCAAGVLRGCGKSVIPMVTMLAFWCGARIVYVTAALKVWPVFQTISWAYPLTWFLSSAVLLVCFGRCKAGWRSRDVRYRFFRGRIECGRLSDGPCIKLSQYILGGEHIFLLDLLDHQMDKAVQIVGEMQVPVIHQVDAQLAVDLPDGEKQHPVFRGRQPVAVDGQHHCCGGTDGCHGFLRADVEMNLVVADGKCVLQVNVFAA